MSDHRAELPPTGTSPRARGAALLTFAGLAAAFGVASCCALPLLLASLGLGVVGLGGVAALVAPHRTVLLGVAAVLLIGGAILLWRQQRHAAACAPGATCTPPAIRATILVGLLIGAGLLWAGYTYA